MDENKRWQKKWSAVNKAMGFWEGNSQIRQCLKQTGHFIITHFVLSFKDQRMELMHWRNVLKAWMVHLHKFKSLQDRFIAPLLKYLTRRMLQFLTISVSKFVLAVMFCIVNP